MADIVSESKRSQMMAGIRSANTRPEIAIRKSLHKKGFRYRLHPRNVPGRPDIALPRFRAALFVNGCFWHGHDCHLFRVPATRPEFWRDKIDQNRMRDARARRQLHEKGWRVGTIWECSIRGGDSPGLAKVIADVSAWLLGDAASYEIRGPVRGPG